MKMLYFKALGNKFKKVIEPLNTAKNNWKYYPRQILLAVGPCDGSTIYDQIYVLENLASANHVDLVSIDTQGRQ